MSGIEIAGLVLGGFPLLISAAEHYREVFEPLLKWHKFRSEFLDFINAIVFEKLLFDQILERFLITAEVPDTELQYLMTTPNLDAWQREDLANMLTTRLGPSYAAFLGTFREMEKLMSDLHDLLLLKDGKIEWASNGASQWDYQMKRLQLSFSKKGPKTLASLEAHTRKLTELLDSKDKLEKIKSTRKDLTRETAFACIRRHASSLHTAITNSWNCNCTSPHAASLQLQHRDTSDWTSHFNMAFELRSQEADGSVKVNSRREVIISIKNPKQIASFGAISPEPSPSEDILLHTSILRRDLESKSLPRTPRPALQNLGSSSFATSSLGFNNIMNKSEANAATSNVSSQSATSTMTQKTRLRNQLSVRIPKIKKSVRMTSPEKTSLHSNAISAPNIVAAEDLLGPEGESAIEDLCSALFCDHEESSSLGYITDDQLDMYHELRPRKGFHPNSRTGKPITLGKLLTGDGTGKRLSRQQRYKLASILAASLLQLQTTPWLSDKLDKGNIFFHHQGTRILVDQPYMNYSFQSKKSSRQTQEAISTPHTDRSLDRKCLNQLGILLLELCFGQPIESQDIRKSYFGPDGKPHSGTDYLTAIYWSDMVAEEDPEFEDIIRTCIFCAFEEKADWKSKSFTQAVYARVVEPLQSLVMNRWSEGVTKHILVS